MDIYRKDKTLQQIRKQIELNEQNIQVKKDSLKKNKNSNIQDIIKLYDNDDYDELNDKKKLIKYLTELINDLDKKIEESDLTNKIQEIKHEKDILKKILEKTRSK
tara:strand:- start:3722 stop:4036 length:315 start_codon:yes stop_codon:yes gene_type:complete